jgi:hypothetical protein
MSEYDGIFPLEFSNPYIYDTPACHTTHPYKELNNQGSIYLHMLHKDVICYTTIVNDQCNFFTHVTLWRMSKELFVRTNCIIYNTCVMHSSRLPCRHIYEPHVKIHKLLRYFGGGDIHVFPIYLTCSLGGRETNICVPSSALMQSLKCGYAHLSFLILL